MKMTSSPKNKNVVVRLKHTKIKANKRKEKVFHKNTYSQSPYNNCRIIYSIRIITYDKDFDSFVLFVDTIADRFREGVILIDNEHINVYLNLSSDFLNDIENMAPSKQNEMSKLSEMYGLYKTYIIYRNKKGYSMILPKSNNFYKAFDRLENEIHKNGYSHSRLCVMFTDVYKTDQNCGEEKHITNIDHAENKSQVEETDFKYREFSIKGAKEKIAHNKKKLLIVGEASLHLPRLPPPIPRKNVVFTGPVNGEHFVIPMQVSEEQRDNEYTRSEQVANELSVISRDNITYGFSPPSAGNSRLFSPVTSHASLLPGSVQQAHGRPRIPPRYPNYSDYSDRLLTFSEGWPHRSPDPPRLSQVGFFFTKNGDLVRCFQCGIGLKDFSSDDDPLLEHVRHSGQCPVLLDVLGEDALTMYKRHLQTTDPEYNRQRQWHERHNSSSARSNYRHPEYETLHARISTFGNWPSQLMQRPEILAEAGLYYTGVEDHVRCFACDGGLRRWDPEDDPWTEHCRWFPACPYAIEQKGEQFIALVQASVENEGFEASGGIDDLPGAMEQLKLRDSEMEQIAALHRDVCLEMGYKEEDLKAAVKELRERGNETPSLEDIIDLIDIIRERKQNNGSASSKLNESPMEENQRLKSFVFCMICGEKDINALFLPCTHHKLCMTCAEPIDFCPVCNRSIREKIRTYMV